MSEQTPESIDTPEIGDAPAKTDSPMQPWARIPFNRGIDYLAETNEVLELCLQGLSHVQTMPGLAEALEGYDSGTPTQVLLPKLQDLRRRAGLAKAEIERGFPVLHAHASVALWGTLDALVADLVLACLLNDSALLKAERFSRIKVPLAEFEALEREDRMVFLLTELSRTLHADLKPGVGKFEALLDAVDLAGPVDSTLRRDLLELAAVRNLLVHRAGIVDRRFCSSCPWLNLTIGAKYVVSRAVYARYSRSVSDYMMLLIKRARSRFPVPQSDTGALSREVSLQQKDTPAADVARDSLSHRKADGATTGELQPAGSKQS